jgi:hypothetical protein
MTHDARPSDTAAELTSTFAEIRSRPAPPAGLTAQSLLRAGQKARRRRRATAGAAGTFSAAAAIALIVGFAFGPANDAPRRDPRPADIPATSPTVDVPQPTTTPAPVVDSPSMNTSAGLNATPSNPRMGSPNSPVSVDNPSVPVPAGR